MVINIPTNKAFGSLNLAMSVNIICYEWYLKNNNIKLGIRSEFVKVAKDESENLVEVNIQKIEDFGNFKLLTTRMGQLTIKSKINREIEIANDKVKLHFPPEKCCVYQNNKLI